MELKKLVLIVLCLAVCSHYNSGQFLSYMLSSGLLLRGIQVYENNICLDRIRKVKADIQISIHNVLRMAHLEAQRELKACQDNIPVAITNATKACEEAIANAVSAALAQHNTTAQAAIDKCNTDCNMAVEDAVTVAITNTNATIQMKLENCLANACFLDTVKCRQCKILSVAECNPHPSCMLTSEDLCMPN